MKVKTFFSAVTALVMIWSGPALALDFPEKFDYLGPEMKKFTNQAGRNLIYIDEGEKEWRTVVFCGGAGTSAQAFYLVEFLHTMRKELKLRVISLERQGFGPTECVPGQTFPDLARDAEAALDPLGLI